MGGNSRRMQSCAQAGSTEPNFREMHHLPKLRLLLGALVFFQAAEAAPRTDGTTEPSGSLLEYVDTRIGTDVWRKQSTLSNAERPHGFVYPGVGLPFAMTQWSPQTAENDIAYAWQHDRLQGFRATHYPNGAAMSEYGAFTIMPSVGTLKVDAAERASSYSHDSETAKPHYYAVNLDDYGIRAELTAASKSGFFRFTYPESEQSHILIDNPRSDKGSYFRVIPERNEIEGFTTVAGRVGNQGYVGREFACYFVARFSKPFASWSIVPSWDETPMEQLFSRGFEGEYFDNMTLSGTPRATRTDEKIDFEWEGAPISGIGPDNFSVRYRGVLRARMSGTHRFYLTSDDGARMFIDGKLVVDAWYDHGPTTEICSCEMEAGREYEVVVEYYEHTNSATLRLGCIEPKDFDAERLVQMARKGSSAAAVCVSFPTESGEEVEVKIGTSFINFEQARRNLCSEIGDKSFEQLLSDTGEAWEEALGKIRIETSETNREIFYTALQRCMLLPRDITEQGYHYSAFNGKIMPGVMYTDFSLWDTFRSLHPLLALLEPDRVNAMIEALLNSYDEGGWIPKWPSPGYSNIMHGTHGDAVIADAYVKGLRNYDERKALEAMMKNATTKGTGHYVARVGILDFIRLGYVPTDKYGESAIRTLEFSYDDFCIAQMARAMGDGELYGRMMARAMNYINILDPETRMVRGRNSDGQWRDAKDPSISGWAQGSDRDRETYFRNITLFVPHDVQGLANFMGGNKALEEYLDYFFDNDFYYVGDEYSMHSPYLYNFIGKAWKTQRTIRRLLDYNFTNDSWGLPGNDDCGQMSSWYVMGAMGFYPVCPGIPAYQIGSPVVDRLELSLANGKTFTLIAENNSPENVYIQSAELNGQPYTKCWISHDDIMDGGTLVLRMGSRPNRKWGASAEDILPSVSAPAGE